MTVNYDGAEWVKPGNQGPRVEKTCREVVQCVGEQWVIKNLKQSKEDILKQKWKFLAKKRAAMDIPDHVAHIFSKLERCRLDFKMMESTVCNYYEMQLCWSE